ncbi:MAG: hypothetical protein U1E63_09160 [Burkholderiales bacterium]
MAESNAALTDVQKRFPPNNDYQWFKDAHDFTEVASAILHHCPRCQAMH